MALVKFNSTELLWHSYSDTDEMYNWQQTFILFRLPVQRISSSQYRQLLYFYCLESTFVVLCFVFKEYKSSLTGSARHNISTYICTYTYLHFELNHLCFIALRFNSHFTLCKTKLARVRLSLQKCWNWFDSYQYSIKIIYNILYKQYFIQYSF